MLRRQGERRVSGRSGRREDFAAAKRARLADREAAESRHRQAVDELAAHRGRLGEVSLSDAARAALLDGYARALSAGAINGQPRTTSLGAVQLAVHRTAGEGTTIRSPAGTLALVDVTLELTALGQVPA